MDLEEVVYEQECRRSKCLEGAVVFTISHAESVVEKHRIWLIVQNLLFMKCPVEILAFSKLYELRTGLPCSNTWA